jgi:hypothetical protein
LQIEYEKAMTMTMGELLCRRANHFAIERQKWLEQWRQTRLTATVIRNGYAKKSLTPEKFMPLPGDYQKQKDVPRMSKEEFKNLVKLWDNGK